MKMFICILTAASFLVLLSFLSDILRSRINIADPTDKRKYRIKDDILNDEYLVQQQVFGFWFTIKSFHDPDPWWAEANAKNLLDELNKEL